MSETPSKLKKPRTKQQVRREVGRGSKFALAKFAARKSYADPHPVLFPSPDPTQILAALITSTCPDTQVLSKTSTGCQYPDDYYISKVSELIETGTRLEEEQVDVIRSAISKHYEALIKEVTKLTPKLKTSAIYLNEGVSGVKQQLTAEKYFLKVSELLETRSRSQKEQIKIIKTAMIKHYQTLTKEIRAMTTKIKEQKETSKANQNPMFMF